MKKEILNYLNKCEGWKTGIKELHWNSSNLSQHKLCDDIAERLADFQDQVGEVEQSISGNLPFNKLKPVPYTVTGLKKFVEDVINDTNDFYKKVKGMGEKYVGMASDCESFLSDMQRNLYLVNFTLKEDFKRNYKNKLTESKNNQNSKLRLTESELKHALNEAVHNVVSRLVIEEGCNEAEVQGGDYNDEELNYTHFAVNKENGLIVDGWDYSGYDTEDLNSHKRGYFYEDLINNGFNPEAYKILSFKACKRAGMDPNDHTKWSNTGVFSLPEEQEMKNRGKNFWAIAYEQKPNWFVKD